MMPFSACVLLCYTVNAGSILGGATVDSYSKEDYCETLRAINSLIQRCEKAQQKFAQGSSQHTLLQNRLKALWIASSLITREIG